MELMKAIRTLLVGLAICAVGSSVGAQISGRDDPAFQVALERWLAGDDMTALAAFADLAQQDNRAAQLFLGVIEPQTWLHESVTGTLPRAERIALLRKPGGLSGRSWLSSAVEDTPLAQSFADSRAGWAGAGPGLQLLEAGEVGAALGQMQLGYEIWDPLAALQIGMTPEIAPYGSGLMQFVLAELPKYAANDAFQMDDPRLAVILASRQPFENPDDTGAAMWGVSDSLHFADINDALRLGNREPLAAFGRMLSQSPHNAALAGLVTRNCPEKAESALGALQMANFGTPLFTFSFSPLESLVPTESYRASPRFERDVLAHLAFLTEDGDTLFYLDTCVANLVKGIE